MANIGVKNELKYAKEVAKIKPLELFNIESCGVTWYQLMRKHLAIDVLRCASNLSCEAGKCLKNEISRECNC